MNFALATISILDVRRKFRFSHIAVVYIVNQSSREKVEILETEKKKKKKKGPDLLVDLQTPV